ncbi:30S ribosomal protein S6e [archaeon]|jgi:small subunit ribosomal protein S6e|nr:30S ribosomal protein S6e [archaeon]MBT4022363.1 30S ribosomal protein S6e [archaeon]MBT4273241.1 30S ribosomal protein S6e [archaeon]MBT4461316.1 30S ribosomal protein S6e [archaeon]MBT4858673.1 30S ribosomal protein S6e [archaeon]
MAEFKLSIGDPKSGKTIQIEAKDESAIGFLNKKIGDKVKGELVDKPGYEFEITGGSDYCGFPMRKDLEGPIRKKIMITQGVGIRNKDHGIRKRKTVCGNTVHEKISLISLKVVKIGKKPLVEVAPETPVEGDAPAAEKKEEAKPTTKKE